MNREQIEDSIYEKNPIGDRFADTVEGIMGSWRFIIIQSVFLALWILLNVTAFIFHWDPYPFVFCNLILSFQAAYASPLILMSQNRQAKKDKARDDLEAQKVQSLFSSHEQLMQINRQQLEILELLRDGGQSTTSHLDALRKRFAHEPDVAGVTQLENGITVIHVIGSLSKERRKQLQAMLTEREGEVQA